MIQSVSMIMSDVQMRAEIAAHNIANVATPAYRARHGFSETISLAAGREATVSRAAFDPRSGVLSETRNPFDVAIAGEGFFRVSSASGDRYTRNGQFSRREDGRLVGLGGWPVQAAGGGDIVLSDAELEVRADGAVLQDGRWVARLDVVDFDLAAARLEEDGLLSVDGALVEALEGAVVHQGHVENSNVSLGDEMIVLMSAMRRAESGQRLMNVYDDLMGRVISTMGQAAI